MAIAAIWAGCTVSERQSKDGTPIGEKEAWCEHETGAGIRSREFCAGIGLVSHGQ